MNDDWDPSDELNNDKDFPKRGVTAAAVLLILAFLLFSLIYGN